MSLNDRIIGRTGTAERARPDASENNIANRREAEGGAPTNPTPPALRTRV